MNHFITIKQNSKNIVNDILNVTQAHPYYTQQLAFYTWERMKLYNDWDSAVLNAIDQIITIHNLDYDRIWATLNRTDMKTMIGLAFSDLPLLSDEFAQLFNTGSTSTTYSAISRLMLKGYVSQTDHGYEIEDPFFKKWIISRRRD